MLDKAMETKSVSTAPVIIQTRKATSSLVNLSAVRRKEELMRILERSGGFMGASLHTLPNIHAQFVQEMANCGEPTSMPPGSKGDRKTIERAIAALEEDGRIKTLIATLPDRHGLYRRTKVVYKSESSPEALASFLKRMGQAAVAEGVVQNSVSMSPSSIDRMFIYEDNHMTRRTIIHLEDLDRPDESAAIRGLMLTDKAVISQLYGAPIGRAARAQRLHTLITRELEKGSDSPWVVSNPFDDRIMNISYLWNDISLSDYCSLVPVLQSSEELDRAFTDGVVLMTPVSKLSPKLRATLQIGLSRSRERLRILMEIFYEYGLATPVKSVEDTLESVESHQQNVLLLTDFPNLMPILWKFEIAATLWKFPSIKEKPIAVGVVPVKSVEDVQSYWTRSRALATGSIIQSVEDISPVIVNVSCDRVPSAEMTASTTRPSRWKEMFVLTKGQSDYLHNFVTSDVSMAKLSTNRDMTVKCLAWTLAAPKETILDFFDRCNRARSQTRGRKVKAHEVARRQLAEKSRQQKIKLQGRWDMLVHTVYDGTLEEGMLHRLSPLKEQYVSRGSFAKDAQWKQEIQKALQLDGTFRIEIRRPNASHTRPFASNVQNKSVKELVSGLSSENSSFISRPDVSNRRAKRGNSGKSTISTKLIAD